MADETIEKEEAVYKSLSPEQPGFFPIPVTAEPEPEGSTFFANLRDNTTWGYFAGSSSSNLLSDIRLPVEDVVAKVPTDLKEYADRFLMASTDGEFASIEGQIRKELRDKSLLAAHPWKSFGTGLAAQALDPVNIFIPGSFLYKSAAKEAGMIARMAGTGVAAASAAGIQEAVLQNSQLARTAEESAWNIGTSALIGGLIGGVGPVIGKQISIAKQKKLNQISETARAELTGVMLDNPKELDSNGLLKENDLANMPEFAKRLMKVGPLNQLTNSPFGTAKYVASTFFESNYTLNKHLNFDTQGQSIERNIKGRKQAFAVAIADVQSLFYKANGIERGPFKYSRAKINGLQISWDDFDAAISHVLTSEQPHPMPEVNHGAEIYRKRIYDPIKNDLVSLGLLPEDISPGNAAAYFMIVFNRQKIIEEGGRAARGRGTLPQALFDGFQAIQERLKVYKESPLYKSFQEQIEKKEAQRRTTTGKALKILKEEIEQLKKNIAKNAPKGSTHHDGSLREILDEPAMWASVEQTVDNILGHTESAHLNPVLDKLTSGGKPLKARKIPLEQLDLRDWHLTSASKVASMYVRATVPHIEMTKAAKLFGADSIGEMRESIQNSLKKEYDAKAKGLTGKAAADLKNKFDAATKNISNSVEILMGVYQGPVPILDNSAAKYYDQFLRWNAIRLLGYMTLSSIPDLGLQVFTNGPFRTLYHGLRHAFSGASGLSRQDLRSIGYAVETELGTRFKSMAEHIDLTTSPSIIHRGMDELERNFGNLTLMNQWNSLMQNIAGHVSIDRTLDTINKAVEGKKVSNKERVRVAKLGIPESDFSIISKYTSDNIDPKSKTRFANWNNWDIKTEAEANALRRFQNSVGQDIDSIVIVPGAGDKPAIGHTPMGKLLFQFKSFLMSATNKVLFAGLQDPKDINKMLGVISMLSLGALSYTVTSYLKGKEPDLSFDNLAKESIDRSGLLGIFMEVYNISEKVLGFGGVSRYQSRDVLGALAGPTGGAITEIAQLIRNSKDGVIGQHTITTDDVVKFMRLMPLQNLFYIDQLSKKVAKQATGAIGVPEKTR